MSVLGSAPRNVGAIPVPGALGMVQPFNIHNMPSEYDNSIAFYLPHRNIHSLNHTFFLVTFYQENITNKDD